MLTYITHLHLGLWSQETKAAPRPLSGPQREAAEPPRSRALSPLPHLILLKVGGAALGGTGFPSSAAFSPDQVSSWELEEALGGAPP